MFSSKEVRVEGYPREVIFMRLVNCSLQWSVSLLNTRNLVRPIAHSDTNSTSSNVETPLVDNGFVKVIPRCIRLAIGGPFETGSRVFGGPNCW